MKTKDIKVPLRDGVMGAHLAVPDRTPAGAIVNDISGPEAFAASWRKRE